MRVAAPTSAALPLSWATLWDGSAMTRERTVVSGCSSAQPYAAWRTRALPSLP